MSSSRSAGERPGSGARSARHQRPQTNTCYLFLDLFVRFSYGHQESFRAAAAKRTFVTLNRPVVTRPARGLAAQEEKILENDDYRGSLWTRSSPWTAATPPDLC